MEFRQPLQKRLLLLMSVVCTALMGCKTVPPPKPLDQLTPQEHAGYVAYQQNCAQCHYERETGSLHGPSLLGVYKMQYLPSGAPANDERVTSTVLHGHGLMPAQPNIDTQDLDDLLAYLHTL